MKIVRPDQKIAIDTLVVPILPAGTGPRRPTTNGMRGASGSATGIRTTTIRTITRLCAACA